MTVQLCTVEYQSQGSTCTLLFGDACAPFIAYFHEFYFFYYYFILILLFTEVWLPPCRQESQPLPEPGADEARRAADTLAGRHDAARPGVALAAGSAQVCDRTLKASAGAAPRQRASLRSYLQGERRRGCAIVLFCVFRTYIRAEGVIKVCKHFLNFDT